MEENYISGFSIKKCENLPKSSYFLEHQDLLILTTTLAQVVTDMFSEIESIQYFSVLSLSIVFQLATAILGNCVFFKSCKIFVFRNNSLFYNCVDRT